jgi:ankyrin repeat protein
MATIKSQQNLAIIMRDREGITKLLYGENSALFWRLASCFSLYSVNYRDNFGMTALHWAVAQNYNELVQDLLSKYNPDPTIQDNEGNTALHLAARNGNGIILQALRAHNADISAVNNNGDTPLHMAIRTGRATIVRQLLEAGAQINIRNHQELSTWSLAQKYHNRQDIIGLFEPRDSLSTSEFAFS